MSIYLQTLQTTTPSPCLVVDRFKESIDKFIKWICKKFDMGAENNLIRDFERENNILLDAEKQVKREEREKDLEMEM